MKLEQSFSVAAPIEQVWDALVDVERIAPCLPGAEVTGVDESGAYAGTFTVKLGPTTASYRGSLRMEAKDEAARTVTMSAKGTDVRGQGGASATIVSTMREDGGETPVDVLSAFHITGRLARFGRSGMIEDISKRLMRDFAACLQSSLGGEPAASGAVAAVPPDDAGATPPAGVDEPPASSGWLGAPTDATGAPTAGGEPDPADAAIASAGGAAAEAASAGSAPPGADDLATGPAAPAPPPPAEPELRPPAEPELRPASPGEAPELGAPGTGPMEGIRSPGDAPVPPDPEPEARSPEAVQVGPADTGAPPVPQPAAPEPAPRTGSIPPPGREDAPAPSSQPAKPGLGERIKRLFRRG
jgi:carbon monoxide dehydrogenase subunit G